MTETGRISQKAQQIAASIKAHEGVLKSHFWYGEDALDSSGVAVWKVERRQYLDAIHQTAEALRKEDREAALQMKRQQELASKNLFTLTAMCYDDPRDKEAYEALEDTMPGFAYRNETLYDLMFHLGMIRHDIDVILDNDEDEGVRRVTERAVKHWISQLPDERLVYKELKKMLK